MIGGKIAVFLLYLISFWTLLSEYKPQHLIPKSREQVFTVCYNRRGLFGPQQVKFVVLKTYQYIR
jgi:hypothetical protein